MMIHADIIYWFSAYIAQLVTLCRLMIRHAARRVMPSHFDPIVVDTTPITSVHERRYVDTPDYFDHAVIHEPIRHIDNADTRCR